MKTIFIAVIAMAVISVGANFGLAAVGWNAASQTSGDAVRLD